MRKCFRCNGIEGTMRKTLVGKIKPIKIVTHHTQYNPEVIVDCCQSCHKKIHDKIKKTKRCPLSTEIIKKLSNNSSSKRYNEPDRLCFDDRTTIGISEWLRETLRINPSTGDLKYSCCFQANNKKKNYFYTERGLGTIPVIGE